MKKMIAGTALLILMSFTINAYSQQQTAPQKPQKISVEERLKHFNSEVLGKLSLTADQQKKAGEEMKSFFTQMDEWHKSHPGQKPEEKEVGKIIKDRDAKIKGILNADQYKKFQELEKQMRDKMKEQMPPPPPPQQNN